MSFASSLARPVFVPAALRLLVATTLLALMLPACAQTGSASGAGTSGATTSGSGGVAGGSASQRSSRAADEERDMFEDLVHASLAEIETGRLALDKTQNPQVRSFAQQMIDDHTKALQEMQQLGQKKQMTVPSETDFQHKAIATALRLLTGEAFDKQYIRQVGVNDHRRTVDLLTRMQQTARDPELKAHAAKMLPIVQRHLAMAREMDQKMK